jgi:hypothetical protein
MPTANLLRNTESLPARSRALKIIGSAFAGITIRPHGDDS